MNFMERLPLGQGMRIRGEDLLGSRYLSAAARRVAGVRTDQEAIDEMKSPEESPYARTGPINAPFGNDPKFLANPKLRSSKVPIPPSRAPSSGPSTPTPPARSRNWPSRWGTKSASRLTKSEVSLP